MVHNKSLENRIYKLSSGELISNVEIENLIEKTCHYVKYVVIKQGGEDQNIAFIFPNTKLYTNPDYMLSPIEGCFCPRDFEELGRCLTGCLKLINHQIGDKLAQVKDFAMINTKASVTDEPQNYQEIIEKYKVLLYQAHGSNIPEEEEIYYIKNI